MYSEEARKAGVEQRRIDVLSAWREAPDLYSAHEQAAIELTEEVTRIDRESVTDTTWQHVKSQFNEKEIVHLLMAISAINVWNRLAIAVHQDLPPAAG